MFPYWRRRLAAAGVVTLFLIAGGAVLARVLGGAREGARQAACRVNVQQLAMGLRMYAADYGERLPPVERWPRAVDPYVRIPLAFQCPARPRDPRAYRLNPEVSGAWLPGIAHPGSVTLLAESMRRGPGARDSVPHPGGRYRADVNGHVDLVGR